MAVSPVPIRTTLHRYVERGAFGSGRQHLPCPAWIRTTAPRQRRKVAKTRRHGYILTALEGVACWTGASSSIDRSATDPLKHLFSTIQAKVFDPFASGSSI